MSKKTKKYTGCIGSIEKARDFARESFVYGLRDKSEHTEISPRAYDEVTRQMGDWFQECVQTRKVRVRNKVKYISLNCREYAANPLYKIWKSCSFTTNEIVFFFFLINYLTLISNLTGKKESVKLSELYKKYRDLHRSDGFDYSAAQKWITNKGCPSGIIIKDKNGKYSLAPTIDLSQLEDILLYFSEIAPGGVIGSYVLDKCDKTDSIFRFKQHYSGQAFDCEVICNALYAIKNNKELSFEYLPRGEEKYKTKVLPVKVLSSTQNGRQYLIAWNEEEICFKNYRIDRIKNITIFDEKVDGAEQRRNYYESLRNHIWGVSLGDEELTHVEFVIKVDEREAYIVRRLNREKRCGKVSPVANSPGMFKFEADVYDAHEMFPWIRTFICRIVELHISDGNLEKLFWDSFDDMYNSYATEDMKS